MAVSLKSIGNEARERYRQQVMREVMKAAAALGLGVLAAALLALQASLIRVQTYDDFVFAQNLRASAFLALTFAAALWAGWFRRPSPRLRLIFHLSEITAISRKIVSTEGEALRRRERKRLRKACRAAYVSTPPKKSYRLDLFLARHRQLFDLIDKFLLTLEWRASRKLFDELAARDLFSIADAIDDVVEKIWSSTEDVDDEMISRAQRLSEVGGTPPAPSWKKAVEILGITSRGELGRFAVYLLVGLAFSASIFVPAALFVGSTPASVLFPTVSTGVTIAGLLQAARHRQKD